MSDSWYIVIRADSGEAYSIGTEIADPMPGQFVALPLSDADAEAMMQGRASWDATSRTVTFQKTE
jgi:hypothetical protein